VQALSEPLSLTIVALAVGFLVVGLYAPMANLYQVLPQYQHDFGRAGAPPQAGRRLQIKDIDSPPSTY
jgi:hypothetical protein